MLLRKENIGGAVVRRGFTRGTEYLKPGTPLTRAEVLAFPAPNRQALADNGHIDIYPPGASELPPPEPEPLPRFMLHDHFGVYHVYEGHRLTDTAISKAEAEAMVKGETPKPPIEEPPPQR